jgi:hypothetical protein
VRLRRRRRTFRAPRAFSAVAWAWRWASVPVEVGVVDAGPGDECGQLLCEFEDGEEEAGGAVTPWLAELKAPAVGSLDEPVVGEGWAEEVAGEMLESASVSCGNEGASVESVAGGLGAGAEVGQLGDAAAAEPADGSSCAGTARDAARVQRPLDRDGSTTPPSSGWPARSSLGR